MKIKGDAIWELTANRSGDSYWDNGNISFPYIEDPTNYPCIFRGSNAGWSEGCSLLSLTRNSVKQAGGFHAALIIE